MLVISRRKGEWITTSNSVRIVVVRICGDKVRLGFEAPKEIAVVRDDAKNKEPRK